MKRKVLFIIIIISLIFSVTDYFIAKRVSYNKYQSGEYFFRYEATTLLMEDPGAWMDSIEAFNDAASRDYSDTKTMLLYGIEDTVWACNPHDGICTVIYGDRVVEDFPVSNLKFENDDEAYFYGTKKLDYKEYIEYIDSLTKEQHQSYRLSDRRMADYKYAQTPMFIMSAFVLLLGLVLILLYRHELDSSIDLVLIMGALFSVIFEAVSRILR